MPRFLIVGGGIAGVSTAWHLVRRGERDVVLLERERLLGTHSSGRNAAVLRTLSADPVTTASSRASARFLHEPPPGFADVPLVDPCGLLLSADATGAAELERWLRAAGPESGGEALDPSAARELAPHLSGEVAFAAWFPREGRLDVAALMEGFERGARAGGAALETGARVERLVVEDGIVRGVSLADGRELRAERTVIAAGGWAGELGRAAGSRVALGPTRRHLLVTAPDARVDPRWPVVWHHGEAPFYARPESGGLLVCACDRTDVEPERCEADPAVRERVAARVARHLPEFAAAGVASFWAGLRTFAPDERFVVGPDPDVPGLDWVAGLGGHGMVCGAAVGALAAARLAGEPARTEAARAFDPARAGARAAVG